jgi:CHAT domain-containing protein
VRKRLLLLLFFLIPLTGTVRRSVAPPGSTFPELTGHAPARPAVPAALLNQLKQSGKLFRAGQFQAAAALAEEGYGAARQARQPSLAARFLSNLGGCRFALHQYGDALKAFLDARALAESAGDRVTAGALDFNISSLYSQIGKVDAAVASAERALTRLTGPERARYLPKLLIHMASLRAQQDRMPEALALFRQGIAAADRAGDTELYAQGWNRLGEEFLKHHELPQAEHALLEAYRIRKLHHSPTLETSYRNLGRLRLEQGDLRSALTLLDEAVRRAERPGGLLPTWTLYYYRGRVCLAQGELPQAWADLRVAVRLLRTWRRLAPPADSARIGMENWDDVPQLYASLVEAGNRLYFQTHRVALAQETLAAAEENRAASLRALLSEPQNWRRHLPPQYWETLHQLELAEVQSLRTPGAGAEARMQQLENALIEWEVRAGSNSPTDAPDLLARARQHLPADTVLLSFHLGSPASYLWAVSRSDFGLFRLPDRAQMTRMAARWEAALRAGRPEASPEGWQLFRALFGPLSPAFRRKPHWLLALDSQLFEVPFAALAAEAPGGAPVFLAERHSLQIVSGMDMLTRERTPRRNSGLFVGIADPVYNPADARWPKAPPPPHVASIGWNPFASHTVAASQDLQLARLPGSAREVQACAAAWDSPQPPILLEGLRACRRQLLAALADGPAVLHFATHVLHSRQHPHAGLIVLSLTPNGQSEVLSAAEIATWNVPGALVSLSGCSSGAADAFAGSGLMGLTRAWLAAGARAVIASHWPQPDDAGALFSSFYGYLHRFPGARPAAALEHAQQDMIRSASWRSNPRYWGAYFITAN